MVDFFEQNRRVQIDEKVFSPDLSRLDPNLTLGHFEEQQEKERVSLKQNLPEFKPFDDLQQARDREFKKQGDKDKEVLRTRVKLFACMYLFVTLILTGFVIYNIVATSILSNESKRNTSKIKELNKMIDRLTDDDTQPAKVFYDLPDDLNI